MIGHTLDVFTQCGAIKEWHRTNDGVWVVQPSSNPDRLLKFTDETVVAFCDGLFVGRDAI